MGVKFDYDFGGYATKNDLKCSDGRTIRKDAFKDCDGMIVPLVWGHSHDDPSKVLGHALLENREDGVYAYGKFNDTEKGRTCKTLVEAKDVNHLSIYANQLKQSGKDVLHGIIREVSLVLAGANPGAVIDFPVLAHSGEEVEDEAIIYTDEELDYLSHSDGDDIDNILDTMSDEQLEVVQTLVDMAYDDDLQHSDSEVDDDLMSHIDAVLGTMNEEQLDATYTLVGMALNDSLEHSDDGGDDSVDADEGYEEDAEEEHDDELTDEEINDIVDSLSEDELDELYYEISNMDLDEGEDEDMKHNVFDTDYEYEADHLSHDDMKQIFDDAQRMGRLSDAIEYHEENGVLAHAVPMDGMIGPSSATASQTYGFRDPDMLFPEYKSLSNTPEWIKRDTAWVDVVMNGAHHTPFSRIKSQFANITEDEARARGYIKGKEKKEEVFTLLKRTTDPQTIYKKQKMDRDDIIDITDFDVVAWIRAEMRIMLDEEIARAALLGDGRNPASDDKIQETHIRPIASDVDLFAIKVPVVVGNGTSDMAKNFITAAIRNRKKYKGTGTPTLFTTADVHTEMLLLEDQIGHRLYKTDAELATALRVSQIVEVEVMESAKDASGNPILGIIVNMSDYNIGADKGGEINMFDDFDIDYNQQKYLIETRCSGALVKPFSAIVLKAAPSGATGATGA